MYSSTKIPPWSAFHSTQTYQCLPKPARPWHSFRTSRNFSTFKNCTSLRYQISEKRVAWVSQQWLPPCTQERSYARRSRWATGRIAHCAIRKSTMGPWTRGYSSTSCPDASSLSSHRRWQMSLLKNACSASSQKVRTTLPSTPTRKKSQSAASPKSKRTRIATSKSSHSQKTRKINLKTPSSTRRRHQTQSQTQSSKSYPIPNPKTLARPTNPTTNTKSKWNTI